MNTAKHIASLVKRIPVNALGMLEGIYRPDLLPSPPSHTQEGNVSIETVDANTSDRLESAPTQEILVMENGAELLLPTQQVQSIDDVAYEKELRIAFVPLCYDEGYPTLDGVPFWSQLPFEPTEAFAVFDAYLRQGRTGMRTLKEVMEDGMVKNMGISLKQVEELFYTYYWTGRAKAFDVYQLASYRRQKELRALSVEGEHFLFAERLMEICTTYLDEQGEELLETLTPKQFAELVKLATQLQRVSVGLPAQGPLKSEDAPAASMELTLRTAAQQLNTGQSNSQSESAVTPENRLADILANPEATKLAQELVIKMSVPRSS